MTFFSYIRITICITTILTSMFCIALFCTSWVNNLFAIVVSNSLYDFSFNNIITSCTVHYLFAIIFTCGFLCSNPLISRIMNNYFKTCSVFFIRHYNFVCFVSISKTTYYIISNLF